MGSSRTDYARMFHEKAVIEKRQMAIERRAGSPARSSSPARSAGATGAGVTGAVATAGEGVGGSRTLHITLNHGEHQDSTLYRFDKGDVVHFCPGTTLLGRKVFLYTNYVVSNNQEEGRTAEFVRNQYYLLPWWRSADVAGLGGVAREEGTGVTVTDTDMYCEVRLQRAGPFHYYFVYEPGHDKGLGPSGSGFYQVSPSLPVPLEGVTCQTVLTRCLGPLSRWEAALRPSLEAGYNTVHLTPVQARGASDSAYSIRDQLRLDPTAAGTFADLENLMSKIRNEWKMMSISDVVLNHTANETSWLSEHPEATYNCDNTPRLRTAALLDALLAVTTREVGAGKWEHLGIPSRVTSQSHIDALHQLLSSQLLPSLRLHEMYICDVTALLAEFYQRARNKVPPPPSGAASPPHPARPDPPSLQLVQDPQYRRLLTRVDMDLALQLYNIYWSDCYDEEARLHRCGCELKARLDTLNQAARDGVDTHLRAAADNCRAGLRYFRLQADGPKMEEVNDKYPLVPRYFTWTSGALDSMSSAEAAVYNSPGASSALIQAHNGWVMDADPLLDFAQDSQVYLRRELIAWGDSVKLRYGSRPEDCPFLWNHMREYVEMTAEVFDGLRLDNCHSTPLHVAEYMLDCARNVNPELYVMAELFTNSDHLDHVFVNRLGITSLIREAQSAWDARELGRQVHRFSGRSVGSLGGTSATLAPALLVDMTHDNPSPLQRRPPPDVLATAALVAATRAASGSTRGLDHLVPHHIHVVDEKRLYPTCASEGGGGGGIVNAKRALNQLHQQLAVEGYSEIYVDQMDDDVVAVTRHHPVTRQSVIVVAFTAVRSECSGQRRRPPAVRFEGQLDQLLLEAELRETVPNEVGRTSVHTRESEVGPYVRDATYINGLPQYYCYLQQHVTLAQSIMFCDERRDGDHTVLQFRDIAPGSVVVLKVSLWPEARAALAAVRSVTSQPPAGLAPLLAALSLTQLNVLLYRCDAEEREATSGRRGVYEVPGHGPLVYAGLQGVISVLDEVVAGDQLGHPLCDNLRAGNWLLDYTCDRLEGEELSAVGAWLRDTLQPLRALPRYLIPCYAAAILSRTYSAAVQAALARCGDVTTRCSLSRLLALTSVQLVGCVTSAVLPPASAALPAPRPPPVPATMSAGLPHFATGYMRCWGRDTFVSLRGLLLLTGRHEEARFHILGYGACLRHGLIPNLLDGGAKARYNCRDAVWWWLVAVQQYCTHVGGGEHILQDPVARLYPTDDSSPAPPAPPRDQPLHLVMQEALDTHFQGLVFRERGAGREIDAHMSERGFTVQVGVAPDTGFVFGGNDANAGTWMDKMGSSDLAGNRGRPATPRDGSAIELVAMAYSTAMWLSRSHAAGHYPHSGVTRRHRTGGVTAWSWAQWATRIRDNFERHFWIGAEDGAGEARPDLVHRRNIYKDTVGASQPWADYQLRCNYVVAMGIAPDLFSPSHAAAALQTAEDLLLAPLGMRTLDPADWAYCGDYDNSDNGTDPKTAHGFNYHQGPEWLWPVGYYLRARLLHASQTRGGPARAALHVRCTLARLHAALLASPWRALPELTNTGGAACAGSCTSQAWSSATIIETLYDLEQWSRTVSLPASD